MNTSLGNSPTQSELLAYIQSLPPNKKRELDQLLTDGVDRWLPLPGPQTEAYHCEADVLFYGGAAGGGKTDLICGLATQKHLLSMVYRREGTELTAIVDRLTELLGGRDCWNGQERIWRLPDRQIEMGSVPHAGDEKKYQGRPHDLKAFDEITSFTEHQFRFLNGWKRTTKEGVRCRTVCTGNPPTDSDGEWVIRYWAPWLDPHYPNPAEPGELRWFAMRDGEEVECDGPEPFEHDGETIIPESRTFIPAKVQDNPYLMATGYISTLQALPEPLRSKLLKGDFRAAVKDDPYQVCPTSWVQAAMDRWEAGCDDPMDSMGVDCARGGGDKTVISRRHGVWFDELLVYPGVETPTGPAVASLVFMHQRDSAPIHVDVIGVGASAYDHLAENNLQAIPVNNSEKSGKTDRSGQLRFVNKRAELYWMFREALDPVNGVSLALPPSSTLKADLCAPRWKLTPRGIQIESKEDLTKRLHRSPDEGDAATLALEQTMKDFIEEDYDDYRHETGRSAGTGY